MRAYQSSSVLPAALGDKSTGEYAILKSLLIFTEKMFPLLSSIRLFKTQSERKKKFRNSLRKLLLSTTTVLGRKTLSSLKICLIVYTTTRLSALSRNWSKSDLTMNLVLWLKRKVKSKPWNISSNTIRKWLSLPPSAMTLDVCEPIPTTHHIELLKQYEKKIGEDMKDSMSEASQMRQFLYELCQRYFQVAQEKQKLLSALAPFKQGLGVTPFCKI